MHTTAALVIGDEDSARASEIEREEARERVLLGNADRPAIGGVAAACVEAAMRVIEQSARLLSRMAARALLRIAAARERRCVAPCSFY